MSQECNDLHFIVLRLSGITELSCRSLFNGSLSDGIDSDIFLYTFKSDFILDPVQKEGRGFLPKSDTV